MTQAEADIPKWAWRISATALGGVAVFLLMIVLNNIQDGQKEMLTEQQSQKVSIEVIKNDVKNMRGDVDTLQKSGADTQQRLYDLQLRIPQRTK